MEIYHFQKLDSFYIRLAFYYTSWNPDCSAKMSISFCCYTSGNFYQFVHINRAIYRKEIAIPLIANIIQIIFLEVVADHTALIKRFNFCIFCVGVNPCIWFTKKNIKITRFVDGIFIGKHFRLFNRILQFRPVWKIGRLLALQIRLRIFPVALQFKDTVFFKCLNYPRNHFFPELCTSYHNRWE